MATTHSFMSTISLLLWSILVLSSASDGGYGPKPYSNEKPNPVQEDNILSSTVAIQGIVFCQSAPKPTPLEGAVVRITCGAVDQYNFETAPYSFLSDATDAKGYFFTTLCPWEIKEFRKLKECKAFLELSPSETCNIPLDLNKGISGASLSFNRFLNHGNVKLFTVRPLYFTKEPKSVSINNNY